MGRQDRNDNDPSAQTGENGEGSKRERSQRRRAQKGPQAHAEGQHGDKTRRAFTKTLHSRPAEDPLEDRPERARAAHPDDGRHRLAEDRQQHDEAEKHSEQNRLLIDRDRGKGHGPSDDAASQ